MRLNLKALFFIERTFANGKHLHFIHGEYGPLFPVHIVIMKVCDVQQPVEIAFWKHGRLIGPDDGFFVLIYFT